MGHRIEKDWTTKAGLRAVCLIITRDNKDSHRCGYVGINESHPLYGCYYGDPVDVIPQELADSADIGKKSPIIALCASVDADDGESVRRSPDIIFDVHGGLTYSTQQDKTYPVESDLFWYGFDCNHYNDAEIEPDPMWPKDYGTTVKSLQYVINECESLAKQLVEFQKNVEIK